MDHGVQPAVRRVTAPLVGAMAGVLMLLAGLVWDAVAHARRPALAHEETVFSVSNPGHALLLLGGSTAVVGLTVATARGLRYAGYGRLSSTGAGAVFVGATVVVMTASAITMGWASRLERRNAAHVDVKVSPAAARAAAQGHGGATDDHEDRECRPSAAERAAAERLRNDTRAAVERFTALPAAFAEGYIGPPAPVATEHYAHLAHVLDGRILDPARPEFLMYTGTSKGPVLTGVMYLMNVTGEMGPEVGGCLTRWHLHDNLCFWVTTFAQAGELPASGTCPPGQVHYIPPSALHVWLVDVPGGPFAEEVDPAVLARIVDPPAPAVTSQPPPAAEAADPAAGAAPEGAVPADQGGVQPPGG